MSLRTIRTRRDLGRVRPWGDNIDGLAEKTNSEYQVVVYAYYCKYFFEFTHVLLDILSESDLCFLLTVISPISL